MLELANGFGKGPMTLKEISRRQGISEKYLWHLVSPLKAAGFITSGRGAHGGYTLAKKPSAITLKKIVETLEGPLFPTHCVGDPSSCKRSPVCVSREIWEDLGEKIAQTLDSVTLEDMIQKQRSRLKRTTGMYDI